MWMALLFHMVFLLPDELWTLFVFITALFSLFKSCRWYISGTIWFNLCIRISERYNIRNIDELLTDIRGKWNILKMKIQFYLSRIQTTKINKTMTSLCYMNHSRTNIEATKNVRESLRYIKLFDDVSEKIVCCPDRMRKLNALLLVSKKDIFLISNIIAIAFIKNGDFITPL